MESLIRALKDNVAQKEKLIEELNHDNFLMAEYIRELLDSESTSIDDIKKLMAKFDAVFPLINKYSVKLGE